MTRIGVALTALAAAEDGENAFEVMVTDQNGQTVDSEKVSVTAQ